MHIPAPWRQSHRLSYTIFEMRYTVSTGKGHWLQCKSPGVGAGGGGEGTGIERAGLNAVF